MTSPPLAPQVLAQSAADGPHPDGRRERELHPAQVPAGDAGSGRHARCARPRHGRRAGVREVKPQLVAAAWPIAGRESLAARRRRCSRARRFRRVLRDLRRPPQLLYVHGELPRGPCVAIVGTRNPTRRAAVHARQFARELAAAGVAILSGGAEGIDTAAHRGALDAGGTTVVVAPAGFDAPFPEENAEPVPRGGARAAALTFRWFRRTRPHRSSGSSRRNACLVALAHVVVVVEAPIQERRSERRQACTTFGPPALRRRRAAVDPQERRLHGRAQARRSPSRSAQPTCSLSSGEQRLHAVAIPAPRTQDVSIREQLEFLGPMRERGTARSRALGRAGGLPSSRAAVREIGVRGAAYPAASLDADAKRSISSRPKRSF